MEALGKEVGGRHYKNQAIQPIEQIRSDNLDFCQGNVLKYVTRYRLKNGAQDLEKAIHYCELGNDLGFYNECTLGRVNFLTMYCKANGITDSDETSALTAVYMNDYPRAAAYLKRALNRYISETFTR